MNHIHGMNLCMVQKEHTNNSNPKINKSKHRPNLDDMNMLKAFL